jgi:uncharacterized protein YndB with AHSA1/START domain
MTVSETTMQSAPSATDREVLITRTFDAPRKLVFQAWTDPEHLKRWHAPQGCTIEFAALDLRQGGTFHSCIRTPDGHDCWCKGVYLEVVPPERLVYSIALADEHGNLVDSADGGKDLDWPQETTVTVTFAEHGAQTKLTLHQTVSEELAKRTGAYPSWLQMFDRLAEDLATAGRESLQ